MEDIGSRLKLERTRLGFNQADFGAIGGVKKLAQIKYEQGERFPGADYLQAVAKVGVDVQYVITGDKGTTMIKPPSMSDAQRAWFKEFEDSTGGSALGLEDFVDGLTTFAEAAQHSIAAYRQEAQATADRLERELNPLIL